MYINFSPKLRIPNPIVSLELYPPLGPGVPKTQIQNSDLVLFEKSENRRTHKRPNTTMNLPNPHVYDETRREWETRVDVVIDRYAGGVICVVTKSGFIIWKAPAYEDEFDTDDEEVVTDEDFDGDGETETEDDEGPVAVVVVDEPVANVGVAEPK
jgi:hypothetical protein